MSESVGAGRGSVQTSYDSAPLKPSDAKSTSSLSDTSHSDATQITDSSQAAKASSMRDGASFDTIYIGGGYTTATAINSRVNGNTKSMVEQGQSSSAASSPQREISAKPTEEKTGVEGKDDFAKTAVITGPDGWSPNVRGAIETNHPAGLVQHPINGESIAGHAFKTMDGKELAANNREQINHAVDHGAKRIEQANVSSIEHVNEGEHKGKIKVTYNDGKTAFAKKVVLATGGGPHATPGERRIDLSPALKKSGTSEQDGDLRVLDLDAFQRKFAAKPEDLANKTVIVHGPNAGIDAVKTVKAAPESTQGVWFIGARPPALLGDNNYSKVVNAADKNNPDLHKVEVGRIVAPEDYEAYSQSEEFKPVKGEKPLEDGNKVRVYYKELPAKTELKYIDVDHYVVSQGQSPFRDGSGAVGDLMKGYKSSVSDAKTPASTVPFEPVYDNGFDFGEHQFETVIGLQSVGSTPQSGVSIQGAAVNAAVSRDAGKSGLVVKHNFDQKVSDNITSQLSRVSDREPELANEFEQAKAGLRIPEIFNPNSDSKKSLDKFEGSLSDSIKSLSDELDVLKGRLLGRIGLSYCATNNPSIGPSKLLPRFLMLCAA